MPPLPPASTMGTSPEGAGRADSLANARAAATSAMSSTRWRSKISYPSVRASDS